MPGLETWWGALFGTFLGVVGGGAGLFAASLRFECVRTTLTAPSLSVLEYERRGGPALLSGTVRTDGERVTAPASGVECVACRSEVKYYAPGRTPRWRTVTNETEQGRVQLTDETGRVELDLSDARFFVTEHGPRRVSATEETDDAVRELLTRDDGSSYVTVTLGELLGGRDLKLYERRIESGDEVVAVVGEEDGTPVPVDRVAPSRFTGVAKDAAIVLLSAALGLFSLFTFWVVAVPAWGAIL